MNGTRERNMDPKNLYSVRRITTVEIDSYAFENLVSEVYGVRNYSFVASMECGNDTQHVFEIGHPDDKNDEFALKEIEEFAAGSSCWPSPWVLLNDLFDKGQFHLEGEVLTRASVVIRVCW